jgi:hypothetical protein
MRMAARAFEVADFWHVKTIAAAKRSGKFPPRVMKDKRSERTSLRVQRHVMMSRLSRPNRYFAGRDFAEEFDERRFSIAGGWLSAFRSRGTAGVGIST